MDNSIRQFAESCIIYRKITNKNDIENFQKDLNTVGKWEVGKGIKINPGKSSAIRFTRTGVKNPLRYSICD
jgi:hypothetical protein